MFTEQMTVYLWLAGLLSVGSAGTIQYPLNYFSEIENLTIHLGKLLLIRLNQHSNTVTKAEAS